MSHTNSLSVSNEGPVTEFVEPHSLAIRIWHWTFFLLVTASMIVVLFASTLFKTRNTMGLVQEQLQGKGATVSQDQARAVAHAYNDKLWDLHTWIGYGIVGLLLIRILIEITQPGEEKLSAKLKKAAGLSPRKEARHYTLVKWIYVLFYGLIGIMALTGLGLAFESVPLFKEWHRGIKQVHAFVQYCIYAFVLIHLVGVIRADRGRNKGLVSGMIHGGR